MRVVSGEGNRIGVGTGQSGGGNSQDSASPDRPSLCSSPSSHSSSPSCPPSEQKNQSETASAAVPSSMQQPYAFSTGKVPAIKKKTLLRLSQQQPAPASLKRKQPSSSSSWHKMPPYRRGERVVPKQQGGVAARLGRQLEERSWVVKRMEGDGNCFFRAVSVHLYGDADFHLDLRNKCMEFMLKDRDHFQNYVAEDFTRYIQRKRQDGCYANNPEIQASSELFNRPIEVYIPETGIFNGPLNIFHGSYDSSGSVPIRLLYTGSAHYDAIIDTNRPGVGHGLGLPGMTSQPTAKRIMKTQLQASDLEATENEMKEMAIQASLGGSICCAVGAKQHLEGDQSPPYYSNEPLEHSHHAFAPQSTSQPSTVYPVIINELVMNGFPLEVYTINHSTFFLCSNFQSFKFSNVYISPWHDLLIL
eukprot:280903_1